MQSVKLFNDRADKNLGTRSRRGSEIKKYIEEHDLLPDLSRQCARRDTFFSIAIPVYNEERYIKSTIESADKAARIAQKKFSVGTEIIIGNDKSTDQTKKIAEGLQSKIKTPLFIFDYHEGGSGATRKKLMDEIVAQHSQNDPYGKRRRYIVMLDGDTIVPKNWLEKIYNTIITTKADMVTNIYRYPPWVDEMIHESIGIPHYFRRLADISLFLSRANSALIRTNGVNSAIDVRSYARINGINVEKHRDRTDTYLGETIRETGGLVAYHDADSFTSPRRLLAAMLKGEFIKNTFHSNFRTSDQVLLEKTLKTFDIETWRKKKLRNELAFLQRYVISPLLKGNLSIGYLYGLFGESKFIKEISDAISKLGPKQLLSKVEIEVLSEQIKKNYGAEFLELVDHHISKIH